MVKIAKTFMLFLALHFVATYALLGFSALETANAIRQGNEEISSIGKVAQLAAFTLSQPLVHLPFLKPDPYKQLAVFSFLAANSFIWAFSLTGLVMILRKHLTSQGSNTPSAQDSH